jgi:cell division protein FtsB
MPNSSHPVRILLGVCWFIIMVVGIAMAQHHDQILRERKSRWAECESVRLELQARRDRLKAHLAGLQDDPEVIEQVIRQKLRWTKPGEVVLGFREEKVAGPVSEPISGPD